MHELQMKSLDNQMVFKPEEKNNFRLVLNVFT